MKKNKFILSIALILSFLSCIALSVNYFIFQYPGNNYFPPQTVYILFALILMYAGLLLQLGPDSFHTKLLKETLFFFMVMTIIGFASNAAQYTPFNTIDQHIVKLEASLHINSKAILAWTHTKPIFKAVLEFVYDSLPYQMIYIPLFIIATQRLSILREYYFLLLFVTTLGFTFYYFFPTTGPASVIDSIYYSEGQRATGLKFLQLHEHFQPTTMEGGMIAFPSYHVIWAWLSLYVLKDFTLLFKVLLPHNLLLAMSCVLLGWHYSIDIFGSIIVILMAHGAYHFIYIRTVKNSLKSESNLHIAPL